MNDQLIKDDLFHIMMVNQKILKPFENKCLSSMTMLQFRTLCVLNGEGRLSLNQLAKIQNISKQQQSILIKGLVENEYVSREIDKTDRRITRFTLTEKGVELLNNQLSLVVESIVYRIKELSEEKQEEAFKAIHTISTILKEIE